MAKAPPGMTALASRQLCAEALGSAFLLAAIVGSGIMGERLAGGNAAIALLANTFATGAALAVLISIFGPISGAHFNPAVTLFFALRSEIGPGTAVLYAAAQLIGAIAGVLTAHAMFAMPMLEVSLKLRDGPAQWWAEFVATFGLMATIAGALRYRPQAVASLVALYIVAAYWFTASTSFANPAVTIAHALTNSFAGIAPHSAPGFILAQFGAAFAGFIVCGWLFGHKQPNPAITGQEDANESFRSGTLARSG
jgi:glycerol uptake facilitator-like aquaporin